MEMIDQEQSVLEEFGLSGHAIRCKRACEVADQIPWWAPPTSYTRGEDIVSTLALRDAVEAIAYTVE
ncbi:hypothetical protein PM082_023252 [Marasmius tenuissimus]|nr:hypothetical protein PM082_023252 [Marasmius tenuissimus]